MTTYAEAIRGTKQILFERGWNKRSLQNKADGSLCVLGAVNTYLTGSPSIGSHPFANQLYDIIVAAGGTIRGLLEGLEWLDASEWHPWVLISAWNDLPPTTFNDVMDVLDKAEKMAEEVVA